MIVQEGGGSALPVKSWKGSTDIRTQYSWDGMTDSGIPAPDGAYRARLSVLYMNDDLMVSEVGPFVVDRIALLRRLFKDFGEHVFSPNGDGRSDTVDIITGRNPRRYMAGTNCLGGGQDRSKYWSWDKQLGSITWDGKNQSGTLVPDGMYYYELRSIDEAQNSFVSPRLPIEVDAARKTVRFDVDQVAFSPNGDGVKDSLYINIQAPKPQSIREFEVSVYALDGSGKRHGDLPSRSWRGGANLLDQYAWDGKDRFGHTGS